MINANMAQSLASDVVPVGFLSSKPNSPAGAQMRRVMADVGEQYRLPAVLSKLNITPQNAVDTFTEISDDMLTDGERHWGRLVVVFVLAAHISEEVFGDDQQQAFSFTRKVGDYVAHRFGSSQNFVRKAATVFGVFALASILYMSR